MKTTDRNLIRVAGLITGAIVLALVTGIAVWAWNPGASYYTDGLSVRQDAAAATVRHVLWEPPEQVSAGFNAEGDAYEPAVTADGRTMVFTRGRAARNADLFVCRREDEAWSEAEPLAEVNSEHDELGPAISPDGQYLFFYSDRPGGQGGYDIWLARWDGYTWTHVTNVGDRVNSGFNEYGPAVSAGGDRLYFSSNRPKREMTDEERDAWEATLREQLHTSDYDIYSSLLIVEAVTNETRAFVPVPEFGEVETEAELNSPKHDGQVAITPRGDFLYLSSNRDGGQGGFDIYRSRYLHGRYEPLENLGPPVNTPANEMDPSLHMEGFGLFFSSNREQEDPRQYRLFTATTREVFLAHRESRWALLLNMLNNVKWWMLLFVAALALIVYLLRNLLDARLRARYSLLNRCIAGSVLVHVLLLFLLSLWFISAEIIQKISEPAMDIALDVDALARERLSLDIREEVTELPESEDALVAEQTTDRLPIPEIAPTEDFSEPVITESSVDSFVVEQEPEPMVSEPVEPQRPVELGELPEMPLPPPTLLMEEREAPRPETTEELADLEAPEPETQQAPSETAPQEPLETPPEPVVTESSMDAIAVEQETEPVPAEPVAPERFVEPVELTEALPTPSAPRMEERETPRSEATEALANLEAPKPETRQAPSETAPREPVETPPEPVVTESSMDAIAVEQETEPVPAEPVEPERLVEPVELTEVLPTPAAPRMEEREAPRSQTTEALASLEAPKPVQQQAPSETAPQEPVDAPPEPVVTESSVDAVAVEQETVPLPTEPVEPERPVEPMELTRVLPAPPTPRMEERQAPRSEATEALADLDAPQMATQRVQNVTELLAPVDAPTGPVLTESSMDVAAVGQEADPVPVEPVQPQRFVEPVELTEVLPTPIAPRMEEREALRSEATEALANLEAPKPVTQQAPSTTAPRQPVDRPPEPVVTASSVEESLVMEQETQPVPSAPARPRRPVAPVELVEVLPTRVAPRMEEREARHSEATEALANLEAPKPVQQQAPSTTAPRQPVDSSPEPVVTESSVEVSLVAEQETLPVPTAPVRPQRPSAPVALTEVLPTPVAPRMEEREARHSETTEALANLEAPKPVQQQAPSTTAPRQPVDSSPEPVVTESSVEVSLVAEQETLPVPTAPVRPQRPSAPVALTEVLPTPVAPRMEEREARHSEASEALANLEAPKPVTQQSSARTGSPRSTDTAVVAAPVTPVETSRSGSLPEVAVTEANVTTAMAEAAVPTEVPAQVVTPSLVMETIQPAPAPAEEAVRMTETPVRQAAQHTLPTANTQSPSVREDTPAGRVEVELGVATLVRDSSSGEAPTTARITMAEARPGDMPALTFVPRTEMEVVVPGAGEPDDTELALARPGRESNQHSSVPTTREHARSAPVPVPTTATAPGSAALAAAPVLDLELPLPELNGFEQVASLQVPSLEMAPRIQMETEDKLSLPYFLRKSDNRGKVLTELGGDDETEITVKRALDWFSTNQEKDGHWSMKRHGGEGGHEVSSTALALLCYFGWGADHMADGPYKDNVRRGIDWMLAAMKKEGDLRSKDMYDQGIGTMALTEAYGLTQDERLKEPAQQAVDYIVRAQNEKTGGWRYNPNDPGDTSVFGWQVMALRSGEMAGLSVPDDTMERAGRWLSRVSGGKHGGLYGYQDRAAKPAMTAEGMFCRQLLGTPPTEPRMQVAAQYLHTRLPQSKRMDFYYYYYATLALYQHQGPIWQEWNDEMKKVFIGKQSRSGKHSGSWSPVGEHGNRMGRVVSTALATLTLEVYYRYLPLYGLAEDRDGE